MPTSSPARTGYKSPITGRKRRPAAASAASSQKPVEKRQAAEQPFRNLHRDLHRDLPPARAAQAVVRDFRLLLAAAADGESSQVTAPEPKPTPEAVRTGLDSDRAAADVASSQATVPAPQPTPEAAKTGLNSDTGTTATTEINTAGNSISDIAGQGVENATAANTPIKNPDGKPMYGMVDSASPAETRDTPGGSRLFLLKTGATAHITTNVLGKGATAVARAATFTSPGQTRYPAAAISGSEIPSTVLTHKAAFGHLVTVEEGKDVYVTLTSKGTTLEDAAEKIVPYKEDQKYKLAFLLSFFPSILEKLSLIHASWHVHEDIKPPNLVILGPGNAGPIDMRDLPCIQDTKKTFSIGYVSPSRNLIRRAAPASDIFAMGRSISRGLTAFSDVFKEFYGLSDLLVDLSKDRCDRPSLITFKTRLEDILDAFKSKNPGEYEAALASIEKQFFA